MNEKPDIENKVNYEMSMELYKDYCNSTSIIKQLRKELQDCIECSDFKNIKQVIAENALLKNELRLIKEKSLIYKLKKILPFRWILKPKKQIH